MKTVLHILFRTNSCKDSRYFIFRKKGSHVLDWGLLPGDNTDQNGGQHPILGA